MLRVLLLCCYVCLVRGEDLGEKAVPVEDPYGLGERLALIDHLRQQHEQDIAPGTELAELRRIYWRLQAAENEPSLAEIRQREGLVALRREILRRFNVQADDSLDLDGLKALRRRLIAESMEEIEELLAEDRAETPGGHDPTDLTALMKRARQAVVLVATDRGSGSGFFVSHNGALLTNRHVCPRKGEQVRVFWDAAAEREPEIFTVVRVSSERDCAALRPVRSRPPYHHLDLGRGGAVGDAVVAIGFPLGGSVGQTLGTNPSDISAHRGNITARRRRGEEVWFLQSDCAISQGNSGGPLIDEASGRVLGMVTSGIDPRESGAHGAVMVFSIPIGSVRAALHF